LVSCKVDEISADIERIAVHLRQSFW